MSDVSHLQCLGNQPEIVDLPSVNQEVCWCNPFLVVPIIRQLAERTGKPYCHSLLKAPRSLHVILAWPI